MAFGPTISAHGDDLVRWCASARRRSGLHHSGDIDIFVVHILTEIFPGSVMAATNLLNDVSSVIGVNVRSSFDNTHGGVNVW